MGCNSSAVLNKEENLKNMCLKLYKHKIDHPTFNGDVKKLINVQNSTYDLLNTIRSVDNKNSNLENMRLLWKCYGNIYILMLGGRENIPLVIFKDYNNLVNNFVDKCSEYELKSLRKLVITYYNRLAKFINICQKKKLSIIILT